MDLTTDVLNTTLAFHNCSDEDSVVEYLIAHGYTRLRAEVLMVFVPIGLCRAVIRRLPANPPIELSSTVLIRDRRGKMLTLLLASVPEFVTALEVGEQNFATGFIAKEQFASTCGSVELNLLNKALHRGGNIAGATVSAPVLLRISEAPGFEQWYQALVG